MTTVPEKTPSVENQLRLSDAWGDNANRRDAAILFLMTIVSVFVAWGVGILAVTTYPYSPTTRVVVLGWVSWNLASLAWFLTFAIYLWLRIKRVSGLS